MKLLSLATFLIVSLLTFSGCVGTSPKPSDKQIIDATLPVVELTKSGIFTDMKAIGFEWKSMKDPRVKGIYVYKKSFAQKTAKHKFIDTIQNRFVTHYIDENVEPASKYAYYFKTYTAQSESNPSKEVVVDTLPVLDSVSWLHVVENMPRSAKIIWRPHTNQIVKRYILERKTLEEREWSELDKVDGRLSAEYIDSKLKDNFVYKYRIRVLTYNGIVSNPSQEVSIVTKPLPTPVESIKVTDNLAKQIKVTWNATNVKDLAYYNVYRSQKIDGSYEVITKSQDLVFIDKIEEDGKDYFYRVNAVDKDGLESMSNSNSFHGKTLAKPTRPSLVGVQMIGNSLELRWSSSDARVKSFVVRKKTKITWMNTTTEDFINIENKSFVDTAIAPETAYSYEVYSVDEFGVLSEASIEVKYTTKKEEGTPLAPKTSKVVLPEQDSQNVVRPMDNLDVRTL